MLRSSSGRVALRLAPLGLASAREGPLFAGVCASFLLLLLVVDTRTPSYSTVGSLGVVPVAAAGWLLPRRLLAFVVGAGLVSRLAAPALAHTDWVTCLSQSVTLLLTAIVAHVAAVSAEATRNAFVRSTLVSRITRIATSAENVDRIFHDVLAEMGREGLGGGVIALIDEQNRLYVAAADGGLDPAVESARLPVGSGVMGQVAARGRPALVVDVGGPGSPPIGTALRGAPGIRSVVAVPLLVAGRTIGVLELDSDVPRRFQPEDVTMLEQIALSIAGATQRAGALQLADERLQRRIREQSMLLEAARTLAFGAELDRVHAEAARAAALIASTDPEGSRRASLLRLADDDRLEIVAEHDELGISVDRIHLLDDVPGLREAVFGTHPVTVTASASPELRERALKHMWRCMAWAPVRAGDVPYGVLAVPSRTRDECPEESLRLLQGVADIVGLAVGNVRRLELERARSHELEQHGQRMAALEHAKSEFLRLVSHELRGPLGVASGYVSMIADGSFGEVSGNLEPVLPVILDKLREMNFLIDQMLETARLDDSQLQLKLETLDVGRLVQDCVHALAGHGGDASRLRLEDAGSPKIVVGDPARLATIVTNLLDNALKYSPDGGEVRCRVASIGDAAVVEVADAGIGIAPEDMPRLFTRFGRLVTPANSHIPGTGLGLYLARELARMHGGDITASSEPGRGSTFTLAIPLAEHS